MAQVIVTESYLENIGDAIRSKLGGTDTYTPAEMAGAISQIHGEPVLEALSVTENGTYNPSSGKDGFSQAVVNVPNSYAAGDEGKVVSNGALVAQTSDTVTENDTYDTTLINQLTVNVAGGGGGSTAILLNEHEYKDTSGGSFSYEKTVTIPKNSTYSIAVISYSNAPTIKINNVAQSYSFYNATDYTYYYTSELALNVGDEISISVTSTGRSAAYAQIIDLDASGDFCIEKWDFTESLTGKVRGLEPTVNGITRDSSGMTFDAGSDYIKLPRVAAFNGVTIEVDVGAMNLPTVSSHQRFIMGESQNGFIYRSSGKWAFYSGAWEDTDVTDGTYFANSTVKVVVDTGGYWHIYKNNVLFFEPTRPYSLEGNSAAMMIGSSGGASIQSATIKEVRVK